MATNAAVIPAAVWKKRRRDRPLFGPYSSASAFIRASARFCRSVCGTGMYSSLDTTRVGIGVPLSTSAARTRAPSSLSLNRPMIDLLTKPRRQLAEARHHLGPERLDRLHQHGMRHQAVVSVAEHPIDRLALLLGFHRLQHGVDRADIGVAQGNHLLRRRVLAGRRVLHAAAEAERLEPGAAGELAGIAPQGPRLL